MVVYYPPTHKPKVEVEKAPIDWGELRAQATKLGLTLSEFQQQEKQRKIRLEENSVSSIPIQLTFG